jgi:TetR/AcrR family transcriptional regulator, transcriptional repressor for nem operon
MGRTSNARSRLLETAMQLMYARGYSAVGVQEICAQAGVNKGSFYHFFPSKQALILAVIEAHGQRLRHIWEDVMQVEEPWHERLQRLFEHTYEAHCTLSAIQGQIYGCPIGNLALELSCQDEAIRQRLRETFLDWASTIERGLRRAIAAEELPAIDPTLTAQAIVAYFEGVLMLAKTHNDPYVVKRLAHGAVHLLEAAVRTKDTRQGQR